VLKTNYKKIDIIKNLSENTGFSNNLSKKLINDLLDAIIQNICLGNLNLKNIGSFRVIKKKQRVGRNPKTKKEFIITARNSISFTPSKKLLEIVSRLI
tara:strand:+ start:7886 stop:8179 length:294 start_codon:yes stop_codon:yes gene_type:complete